MGWNIRGKALMGMCIRCGHALPALPEEVKQGEGRVMVERRCPRCGNADIEWTGLDGRPAIDSCTLESPDGGKMRSFAAAHFRISLGTKPPSVWQRIWARLTRPLRRKLPGENGSDNGYARGRGRT